VTVCSPHLTDTFLVPFLCSQCREARWAPS